MAALDFTIGFSQAEVEAIFTKQKAELAKVIASYSESGSQVIKRKLDDTAAIVAACQRALQAMDPDCYGPVNKTAISAVSPYLDR